MNLIALVLRRPTYILALWMIIGVLGVRSYLTMPVDLFPDTVPPQIVVMTVVRGAAAEDVNRLVSSLIDREIKGISGLTRVTATSRDEISSVNAQFAYDRDIGLAMNDVINAVNRIKGQFPPGTQEPQVFRITDANRPLLTLAVTPRPGSGLDLPAVRMLAENDLKEELLGLPGVGRVDVFGANQPEVLIRLDQERLRRYDLTPEVVLTALGAGNLSLPGGYWLNQGRESLVKTLQEARQPDDLAVLPLRIRQGGIVTVGDVASISLRTMEPRSFYHGNASPAIALNILKPEGGHGEAGLASVKAHLPRLKRAFPGLAFAITTDQQPIIDLNVAGMKGALFSAVWLTMLVVFVLLLEIRTSLVIGVSIPLSFLSAFAFLYYTPFTINMVILSGLIIAVGMVVDAAIVVVENVFRHLKSVGKTQDLVISGTSEVVFSILGGMLTTIVVMVPIMFVGGYSQQVLRPLTMTISATLAGSFLAALTIVPLLLGWLFQGSREHQATSGGWLAILTRGMDRGLGLVADVYLTLLAGALRARIPLLIASFLVLGLTARLTLPLVGRELMPRMDTGMLTIRIDLPPAMPLTRVEGTIGRFEAIIARHSEVLSISTVVGAEPGQVSFGAGGQLLQQAEIQVRLTTRDRRATTIWEIMEDWRNAFAAIPGPTAVAVTEFGATPMSTTRAPIDVQVTGRDPAILAALTDRILTALRPVQGLRDLRPAWTMTKPETHFLPHADLAYRFGLTPRILGEYLGVTLTGRVPTRLKMAGFLDLPIRVDIGRDGQRWDRPLLDLVLPLTQGDLFLSAIGETRSTVSPTLLTREDLLQTSDILGINAGRPVSAVAADVQQILDGITPPEGYQVRLTGTMADMADSGQRLGGALFVGIIFLYIVLWVLFESWWRPLLVMISIPLSLIGAFWGLVFFDKPMCQPAMMGLILLGGTIVNNAIILIDFIDQARAGGMERREALFQAVRIRLRPILITTASTVLGLLPLVLEQAVGLERMSPLGIVASFGLTLGTLLTLVCIPAWYDLVIDVGERLAAWWKGSADDPAGSSPSSAVGSSAVTLTIILGVALLLTGGPGATPPAAAADVASFSVSAAEPLGKPARLVADEAVVGTDTADVYDVAACLRLTLERNPALDEARAETAGARGGVTEARAAFQPQIEGGASWKSWDQKRTGALGQAPGGSQFTDDQLTDLRLQIRQLLWDSGQARARLQTQRFQVAARDLTVRRVRQELTADVLSTALTVFTAETLLTATDENLRDVDAALARGTLLVQVGRAARIDLLRLEARRQETLETRETWRHAREAGLAHLGSLMGLATPPRQVRPGGFPALEALDEADLEVLLAMALATRPDLAAQRQAVRGAQAQTTGSRRSGAPTLSVLAGGNRYGNGDGSRQVGAGFVGLDLSWTLADGGRRAGRVRQASAAAAAARARLTRAELAVGEQIRRAYSALHTARARLDRAVAGLAVAEEAHRIELTRFEQGRGTVNDLLDAESALFSARAQKIRADNDRAAARLALVLAAGHAVLP